MKKLPGFLFLVVVLILSGCGSNESEAFKVAGCIAADENAFDEAGVQFNLAAQSGDPAAVAAAIASQNIWASFMSAGDLNSLEEIDAVGEYVSKLGAEIASYCGSGYDIQ